MFQRMIDDFKESTGNALRLTYLATAAAAALFVTTSFLCAAAFVAVMQNYGVIAACLAGAGVFLVVALIAILSYMARQRQAEARAARAAEAARANARSAARTALADPMLVSAGIQIIRSIGIKRLVPLTAIGGVALGLFVASRSEGTGQAPAE
jgi:hypothetical protein